MPRKKSSTRWSAVASSPPRACWWPENQQLQETRLLWSPTGFLSASFRNKHAATQSCIFRQPGASPQASEASRVKDLMESEIGGLCISGECFCCCLRLGHGHSCQCSLPSPPITASRWPPLISSQILL